jgi:hypothetical protein
MARSGRPIMRDPSQRNDFWAVGGPVRFGHKLRSSLKETVTWAAFA